MERSRPVRVALSVVLLAAVAAFGALGIDAVDALRTEWAAPLTDFSGDGVLAVTHLYVISGSIVAWEVAVGFGALVLVALALRRPARWWIVAAAALVLTAVIETAWRAADLRLEHLDLLHAGQLAAAALGLAAALAALVSLRAWRGSPAR